MPLTRDRTSSATLLPAQFPTVPRRTGYAVEARHAVERLPTGYKTATSVRPIVTGIDLFDNARAARRWVGPSKRSRTDGTATDCICDHRLIGQRRLVLDC